MRRSLLAALTLSACAILVAVPAGAADKKELTEKAALQKVGEYVGEWKANGKTKLTGKETFWKETLTMGWKFKDGTSAIALEIKDGKFYTSGVINYDTEKKVYKLVITDKDKKAVPFDGTLVKGNLVFTRTDADSGDVQKLTLYTVADGARIVVKSEVQSKGKGLFSEQFSLAGNKEGESFAGGGGAGGGSRRPECIVTGGAGTMQVAFGGKTYYVCCSGCREEFEANPKKYVDAFEKAAKK